MPNVELTSNESDLLVAVIERARELAELANQYRREAEVAGQEAQATYRTIMRLKNLNPDGYSLTMGEDGALAISPLPQSADSQPAA